MHFGESRMKRTLFGLALVAVSMSSFAVSPGGSDCGWGNMLFKGKSGIGPHFLASTTNGTSGNASFGMTSGTNGCSVNGSLTYGGKPMINLASIMDEFSEDAARGDGEAMTAVAVSFGVEPQDRDAFSAMVHSNFSTVFPSENVTAGEVMESLVTLMKQDQRLSKYVS
jgi:hypothetical protein